MKVSMLLKNYSSIYTNIYNTELLFLYNNIIFDTIDHNSNTKHVKYIINNITE